MRGIMEKMPASIVMFGTILTSGVRMPAKAGFNQRKGAILSLSDPCFPPM